MGRRHSACISLAKETEHGARQSRSIEKEDDGFFYNTAAVDRRRRHLPGQVPQNSTSRT